jgi:dTDP-4-amino-4,6-dideoxygalactose transaminase
MRVPLARPLFDEDDERAVVDVLRSGWVGAGPRVARFESEFARYTGATRAVAVSSCTAALHVAMLALGLRPGDEVLVPAFTWISSANAAELVGAKAVFCDIDPTTYNIDVRDAARRVTPRTRAIMPVHLFGLAADMQAVCALAEAHRLHVIEDAACALGTTYKGRHVGTFGIAACFSLHPRKSITTGEGGIVTTSDASLESQAKRLRDIGADREGLSREDAAQQLMPDFPVLGFNYRLTDLQAALGLTQLAKFDRILAQRLDAARRYEDLLSRGPARDWLRTPAGEGHSYQSYVCRFRPPHEDDATVHEWHGRRNRLMQRLAEEGVATRPGTHAPHLLGYYRDKYALAPGDCRQAWLADWLTISLPLFAGITPDEQAYVCDHLQRLWKELA